MQGENNSMDMKTQNLLAFKTMCAILFVASLVVFLWYPISSMIDRAELMKRYYTGNKTVCGEFYAATLIPVSDETIFMPIGENKKDGSKVLSPLLNNSPTTVIVESKSCSNKKIDVVSILLLPLILGAFSITFFILFIRLISSFSKSRIFDRGNSLRLMWMGISLIVINISFNALQFYMARQAIDAIELEKYVFTYPEFEWGGLLFGLGILVMNEVLRIATSIKEEQDLTI